jgi:hypothetical protein
MNEPEDDEDDDDHFNPFYLSQHDCDTMRDPNEPDLEPGWFYWLPDGHLVGPFKNEAEASAEAANDERGWEEAD